MPPSPQGFGRSRIVNLFFFVDILLRARYLFGMRTSPSFQRGLGVGILAIVPGLLVVLLSPSAHGDPPQGDTPKCEVIVVASQCNQAPPGQHGCYRCNANADCIFFEQEVTDYSPHCMGKKVWITAALMNGPCPDRDCSSGPEP